MQECDFGLSDAASDAGVEQACERKYDLWKGSHLRTDDQSALVEYLGGAVGLEVEGGIVSLDPASLVDLEVAGIPWFRIGIVFTR